MKSVLCENFGPPENLNVKELDDLEPGPNQVRIDIEACGVNFPDTLIIEDKYQFKPPLPFSPGGEVAGVVDKIGSNVKGVKLGDKVMAMTLSGGFSEQILVDASGLLYRPKGMDGVTASGTPSSPSACCFRRFRMAFPSRAEATALSRSVPGAATRIPRN